MKSLLFALLCLLAFPALASEPSPDQEGEVRVPLAHYQALLQQLALQSRPAPAAYAVGQVQVKADLQRGAERHRARVDIELRIETFEDEWTLVPVLPGGTALAYVRVDGRPVQLVEGPEGLSWASKRAGAYSMQLGYTLEATAYEEGFTLPLAIPRSPATQLDLSYPEKGVDFAIVPASDREVLEDQDGTRIKAAIPATSSIMVSWRKAGSQSYAVSRARYEGALQEDAVIWKAVFEVELFSPQAIVLPLLPESMTLKNILVDAKQASVLVEDGRFAAIVKGAGSHEVTVQFQTPVASTNGPPQVQLQIPKVPVSRFDLRLPGRKDVRAQPGTEVRLKELEGETLATSYIPISEQVAFSWTEAIPDDLRAQVRKTASLYHLFLAEEGVMNAKATLHYEITHGETGLLKIAIPEDAQVNRIGSQSESISDWAVGGSDKAGEKTISVFLDRPVSGEYIFEIEYERLLGPEETALQSIETPLLRALDVQRQRGMVALLSGEELALSPLSGENLTKVGENQLPAFIRNRIERTIAHTYKYSGASASLVMAAVVPEREQGRFDAQIDTLISLGEVALKGSASVEIDVKSGGLFELELSAPGNVNLLGVSGPSLRSHDVRDEEGHKIIALEFTREMKGRFRIEVNYEQIMNRERSETLVPTISAAGAEVEHGRIGVEALSAVEVQTGSVQHLSSLDINELPRQLILKTTNPILLAFRYVSAERPFKLGLKITRHQEIELQAATIERAAYKTLLTRDGLAVTTARLIVRNSRRQFLRLAFPENSEVWSVFVEGKAEKPAFAGEGENLIKSGSSKVILIKLINSAKGFPVDIVFATPLGGLGSFGTITASLPQPDIVATHSRWDVYLPPGPHYARPDSNMDLVLAGLWANPRQASAEELARVAGDYQGEIGNPLKILVPTKGVRYSFEKLYANQSDVEAFFSIRYSSMPVNLTGLIVSLLGVLLLWTGIVTLTGKMLPLSARVAAALIGSGALLVALSIGYLATDPLPASGAALGTPLLYLAWLALKQLSMKRHKKRPA